MNVWGFIYLTHYGLEALKKRHGTIAVVSSLLGILKAPTRTIYSASKHALHGFFESLRLEPEICGILDICIICPGFVKTEIHEKAFTEKKTRKEDNIVHRPKDIMSSEECARLMVESVENRDKLYIMTTKGQLGYYLRPFFPNLIDSLSKKNIQDVSVE